MNYSEKIRSKDILALEDSIKALEKIKDLSWEDSYWLLKYLYIFASDKINDSIFIEEFENTFSKGLNFYTNKELYLDVAQMMARLYIKYKRYDEAINFLMNVTQLSDNVEDWVHLYYALAQVMSDNIIRISQKPKFFYARLDKISEKSFSKRDEIFILYLQRIHDCVENKLISDYDQKSVEEQSKKYNLSNKWNEIFNLNLKKIDNENDKLDDDKQVEEIELTKNKDNIQIKELQSIIELKDAEINELKLKISELESKLNELIPENIEINKESEFEFNNNGHALLNRYQYNQKILVIGALPRDSEISQIKLRAKKMGFDPDKDFDYYTDYDKIKNIAKQINFGKYSAIITGPMPHSTAGRGDSSSLVEELRGDAYPYTVEAKTESGKLKLTASSFVRALNQIVLYLGVQ